MLEIPKVLKRNTLIVESFSGVGTIPKNTDFRARNLIEYDFELIHKYSILIRSYFHDDFQ